MRCRSCSTTAGGRGSRWTRRRPTRSRPRSLAVHRSRCGREGSALRLRRVKGRPRCGRPRTDRCSCRAASGSSTPRARFCTRARRLRSAAAAVRATRPSATARTRRSASMADAPALTLYQAEWCPLSSAVREVLTELGLDFVARQVEPWPNDRSELEALAGSDQIPVLQVEDGTLYRGTREIFAHLHERDPWRFAAAHRRRFAEHRDARVSDAPGQLIEYFRGTDELEAAAEGPVAEAEVVDVPEAS